MTALATGPNWDHFAASYRRQLWLERGPLLALLRMLAPAPGDALLDVGTGTAELLALLAREPGRPARAVGLDASEEMLARAAPLPDGWRLERDDAAALPFADASFDVITAAYLLHLLDPLSRRRVIAEIARVLRPGGRVGTLTIAPPRTAIGRALSTPLVRAARRSQGRLAGMRPLDPSAALAAAGLELAASRRSWRGYPSLCIVATQAEGGLTA